MLLHHRCQKHKAVLNFFFGAVAVCEMLKCCFLKFRSSFTIKQIKMLIVQICYYHCEHVICPSKIQSIYLPERNKCRWILIHPRIAQCLIFCNFQPFKQLSAILADVKKAFQHTHAQRLAEATGTSNQRHFRSCSAEQFSDQTGFINIVIPILTNFFKVRNSNRNIHFFHLCRSLLVAMHGLFIVSMIP